MEEIVKNRGSTLTQKSVPHAFKYQGIAESLGVSSETSLMTAEDPQSVEKLPEHCFSPYKAAPSCNDDPPLDTSPQTTLQPLALNDL